MSTHTNTLGESLSITHRELINGDVVPCLNVNGDPPPLGSKAGDIVMLDAATRRWLRGQLDELDAAPVASQETP